MKKYLEGGCASFALALNILTGLPIYVMKYSTGNGLDTHLFVYDKKKKLGIDAEGYFNPKKVKGFKVMRNLKEKDVRILSLLHLIPVTKKSISEAKSYIKKTNFLETL